jgi:multidrug resistance efflux pump
MSDPLPPIPRPTVHRMKDLRHRHVPVIVYLLSVVVAVFLWNTHWMPTSFSGEVQASTAEVASSLDGVVMDLAVERFDRVTRGQELGRITVSPESTAANLASISAELQVMRARMEQDQERNRQGYQRLRLDLMDQQVELSVAQSSLRFADSELQRMQILREKGIESQAQYEQALLHRDALAEEVRKRGELEDQLRQSLAGLDPASEGGPEAMVLDSIEKAIQASQENLQRSSETILRAPIDGVVTRVYRRNGENIRAGEPLVGISGDQCEGIVGYIRQPVSFLPQVGDVVVVRSRRGYERKAADARIVKVGGSLEYFAQTLRVRGFDSSQERGLPVLITVPGELALYPGEIVDLSLKN